LLTSAEVAAAAAALGEVTGSGVQSLTNAPLAWLAAVATPVERSRLPARTALKTSCQEGVQKYDLGLHAIHGEHLYNVHRIA